MVLSKKKRTLDTKIKEDKERLKLARSLPEPPKAYHKLRELYENCQNFLNEEVKSKTYGKIPLASWLSKQQKYRTYVKDLVENMKSAREYLENEKKKGAENWESSQLLAETIYSSLSEAVKNYKMIREIYKDKILKNKGQ